MQSWRLRKVVPDAAEFIQRVPTTKPQWKQAEPNRMLVRKAPRIESVMVIQKGGGVELRGDNCRQSPAVCDGSWAH